MNKGKRNLYICIAVGIFCLIGGLFSPISFGIYILAVGVALLGGAVYGFIKMGKICPDCDGSGVVNEGEHICDNCNGKGRV